MARAPPGGARGSRSAVPERSQVRQQPARTPHVDARAQQPTVAGGVPAVLRSLRCVIDTGSPLLLPVTRSHPVAPTSPPPPARSVPRVPALHSAYSVGSQAHLVMQYLPGGDALVALQRRAGRGLSEAQVAAQVCSRLPERSGGGCRGELADARPRIPAATPDPTTTQPLPAHDHDRATPRTPACSSQRRCWRRSQRSTRRAWCTVTSSWTTSSSTQTGPLTSAVRSGGRGGGGSRHPLAVQGAACNPHAPASLAPRARAATDFDLAQFSHEPPAKSPVGTVSRPVALWRQRGAQGLGAPSAAHLTQPFPVQPAAHPTLANQPGPSPFFGLSLTPPPLAGALHGPRAAAAALVPRDAR